MLTALAAMLYFIPSFAQPVDAANQELSRQQAHHRVLREQQKVQNGCPRLCSPGNAQVASPIPMWITPVRSGVCRRMPDWMRYGTSFGKAFPVIPPTASSCHPLPRTRFRAGRIPVIEVFALLAQNAYFSSRSLVESMVHELFVPDLRWLRDGDDVKNPMYLAVKAEVERAHAELNGMPLPKGTERSMWQQFQDLSGARGVWLTAIDQAHALCVNHRNTDPADHILNLMSILEKGEMNILLSGVHGAADLWVQRPEVRRRTTPIWMPPYSYERKQDRDPFLTLLRTLGQRYTFSKRTLLFEMASELMAASAGIFGVVRKILVDAEERARCAGRVAITKTDIADSYYGERDYEKMWEDVRFFEEVMKSASTKSKAVVVSRAWGLGKQSANRDKALNPVTTAT